MSRSSMTCLLLAPVLACAFAAPVSAADARAASYFVQAGNGEAAVRAGSVGLAWDLPWRGAPYGRHGVSTRLELFASRWRTPSPGGGHQSLLQVAVVPVLRVRFDDGRSPWFLDAGIGLSLLDGDLRMPDRRFSTRLNFNDNLAIGRNFGAQGGHEVSLHVQHTSNAGFRKPNPGLNLVMLRYAHAF
jgi:lipid A 3-O-deacylase